jgi:hypothetical protein
MESMKRKKSDLGFTDLKKEIRLFYIVERNTLSDTMEEFQDRIRWR